MCGGDHVAPLVVGQLRELADEWLQGGANPRPPGGCAPRFLHRLKRNPALGAVHFPGGAVWCRGEQGTFSGLDEGPTSVREGAAFVGEYLDDAVHVRDDAVAE